MFGAAPVRSSEKHEAAGISFALIRKRIKTMHIYVKPPDGRVLVTCPYSYPLARVEAFVEEKQAWIRKHMERYRSMPPQEKMELSYETGEKLYVWGVPLTLEVRPVEGRSRAKAEIISEDRSVILTVPGGYTKEQRGKAVDKMYKAVLEEQAGRILEYWQEKTGLRFDSWHTRKMKSRWGSCNYIKKRICLNTRLAEKDLECLEYVALHEIAHLKEPNHGPAFKEILDRYMPDWRRVEKKLK